MYCESCLAEKAHYHILMENGKVRTVWYVSVNGYWDRELEKDEWFVELKDYRPRAKKQPKPAETGAGDWLTPKVYKGSSAEEDDDE